MTQSDLCFDAPVRMPTFGTQAYEILAAMKNGKRLTIWNAMHEHGVGALSQRIGELKRMGWPIYSTTITTPGGARVSEYWMYA